MNQLITDEEIIALQYKDGKDDHFQFARDIEQAILAKLNSAEPVAWDITVHEKQTCYLVEDVDDALDDLTNHSAIATPLYLHPPTPSAVEWQPIVANFIHQFKRHVGGDGEFWLHELEDFYTNMAAARSKK